MHDTEKFLEVDSSTFLWGHTRGVVKGKHGVRPVQVGRHYELYLVPAAQVHLRPCTVAAVFHMTSHGNGAEGRGANKVPPMGTSTAVDVPPQGCSLIQEAA